MQSDSAAVTAVVVKLARGAPSTYRLSGWFYTDLFCDRRADRAEADLAGVAHLCSLLVATGGVAALANQLATSPLVSETREATLANRLSSTTLTRMLETSDLAHRLVETRLVVTPPHWARQAHLQRLVDLLGDERFTSAANSQRVHEGTLPPLRESPYMALLAEPRPTKKLETVLRNLAFGPTSSAEGDLAQLLAPGLLAEISSPAAAAELMREIAIVFGGIGAAELVTYLVGTELIAQLADMVR